MERQITIRLSEDLLELIDRRAKRMRRKRAELVRMALEKYIFEPLERGRKTPYERAKELGLIGAIEMGPPDLAEKHREYLEETGFGRKNNFRE